jgi:multicomponent Na+:H+ antiporter subunit C
MNASALFALAAAGLIGLGLYGMLAQSSVLRKVLAFNLLGVGVFLVFGVVARRGAAAGLPADPVKSPIPPVSLTRYHVSSLRIMFTRM